MIFLTLINLGETSDKSEYINTFKYVIALIPVNTIFKQN